MSAQGRKATLIGTFLDVDKALKDNFLGIILEIREQESTQTEQSAQHDMADLLHERRGRAAAA